jgi:hypothetical protein
LGPPPPCCIAVDFFIPQHSFLVKSSLVLSERKLPVLLEMKKEEQISLKYFEKKLNFKMTKREHCISIVRHQNDCFLSVEFLNILSNIFLFCKKWWTLYRCHLRIVAKGFNMSSEVCVCVCACERILSPAYRIYELQILNNSIISVPHFRYPIHRKTATDILLNYSECYISITCEWWYSFMCHHQNQFYAVMQNGIYVSYNGAI